LPRPREGGHAINQERKKGIANTAGRPNVRRKRNIITARPNQGEGAVGKDLNPGEKKKKIAELREGEGKKETYVFERGRKKKRRLLVEKERGGINPRGKSVSGK